MYAVDKKKVFWKEIADETVLINIDTGVYYSLDKLSARIWNMIAENKDKKEIISRIIGEYDVDEKVAQADVSDFLSNLEKESLLEIK